MTLFYLWYGSTPHEPFEAGPTYKAMCSNYSEDEQNSFGCITAMDDQMVG